VECQEKKMSFDEREKGAPETFKADTLWKAKAYRLALYLSDLCWQDGTVLLKDKRTVSLADQLYRAVGSVSANLAEGFSRSTGKDRALFYQYALGSAR
jgi:four helix bundle protein